MGLWGEMLRLFNGIHRGNSKVRLVTRRIGSLTFLTCHIALDVRPKTGIRALFPIITITCADFLFLPHVVHMPILLFFFLSRID